MADQDALKRAAAEKALELVRDGMLLGLGLGVVVGTLGALLPRLTGAEALGLNPLAIVVTIALTGAAFGAMAGSLSRAD